MPDGDAHGATDPASGLATVLAAVGVEMVDGEANPMFNVESIAAALVDRSGAVVCATPAFEAMRRARRINDQIRAALSEGPPRGTFTLDLTDDDGESDLAVFAYAPAGQAAAWRLPPAVRAAAAGKPDHTLILTSWSAAAGRPLEYACRAYGLNGLQTRVVLETIRAGNVRAATRALGVSYHTAREALAQAMKRARVQRLPALVNQLTSLAFGVLPDVKNEGILTDLWGLSRRQAAVAVLVASGLTRAEAAGALSLGEAVVKKELDRVYLVLQVGSGAALARKVVEANALRWLMLATKGDIGFADTAAEPLQFVHRADGRRVAISDYGPASGRPLLVVHSSMTSRIVARGLLRALQAAGYRPIAIDRPGFGLTEEVAGARPGEHDPYAAAARDAMLVLDHLKIRAIDLVARGGAQFVLALERAAPGRLGRVVLTNPAPHTSRNDRNVGALGAIKEAFRRNPAMIRLAAMAIVRQSSFERVSDFMLRSMRGSPPDELAMRSPEILRDYFLCTRAFGTGRFEGYVNEQIEFARGSRPPPIAGTTNWRVLVAAHDVMHDPQHVIDYWRRVLPDARFELIPETGRLLALSHPHLVVAALRDA